MNYHFPIRLPALRVSQPIGTYFVVVIPARLLLDIAYSHTLSARRTVANDTYALDGTQRVLQDKRLGQIAQYISREDAAFPNSIILAANYRMADGMIEEAVDDLDHGEQAKRRWFITTEDATRHTLTIPSAAKLAAIIDGQHRLFAFTRVGNPARLNTQIICSVFLDLPKPLQAQLFAVINSTQKAVSRSQTYELFGYNLEDENPLSWSPDKLAVFFARRLNTDDASPLKGRIAIAAVPDEELGSLVSLSNWRVSMAVIVDGVLKLISRNPKLDSALLLTDGPRQRSDLDGLRRDTAVLRDFYIRGQDQVLFTLVRNYLEACNSIFWASASEGSFIVRAVGVQALFDILALLALDAVESRDISVEKFRSQLMPAKSINFGDIEFKKASGSGRTAIRRKIASVCGLSVAPQQLP